MEQAALAFDQVPVIRIIVGCQPFHGARHEIGDDRITLAVEVHGLPFKAELPMSPKAEQAAGALLRLSTGAQAIVDRGAAVDNSRGELRIAAGAVLATGHAALDVQLPGGG